MGQTPDALTATPSQTVGPFFHFGLADHATLGCLVRADTNGERIRLTDPRHRRRWAAGARRAGRAVAGGCGRRLRPPRRSEGRAGAARLLRLRPAADGRRRRLRLRDDSTRAASRRAGPDAGVAHQRLPLRARASAAGLHADLLRGRRARSKRMRVLALVPEDRRQTLLARRGRSATTGCSMSGLQGEGETVFFDLLIGNRHVITLDRQPGDDRCAGGGVFGRIAAAGDAGLRSRARQGGGEGRRHSCAGGRGHCALPPTPTVSTRLRSPARRASPARSRFPSSRRSPRACRRPMPESARFVHLGATSQDVADSAMVLTIRRARAILAADHAASRADAAAVVRSSRRHGDARADAASAGAADHVRPEGGRLGGRARRAAGRGVDAALDEAAVLQFGGASGTLAALGDRGLAVRRRAGRRSGASRPRRALAHASRSAGRAGGRVRHLHRARSARSRATSRS